MKRPRAPSPQKLQEQCDEFNAKCTVGQKVVVKMDSGDVKKTVTRSKAEVLSGHSAVIWLEDITGFYRLDRVTISEWTHP